MWLKLTVVGYESGLDTFTAVAGNRERLINMDHVKIIGWHQTGGARLIFDMNTDVDECRPNVVVAETTSQVWGMVNGT